MLGKKPVSKPYARDIIGVYEILGHPSEEMTHETPKMASMQLTGEWRSCAPCTKSRVRRFAVPKTINTRAGRALDDCSSTSPTLRGYIIFR